MSSSGLGFKQVVFDAAQADELGRFWAALVGREVEPGANRFFAVVPGSEDGGFPKLMFIAVPEPRTSKNRLHLDFGSEDRKRAVDRAISLGASHVADYNEFGVEWTTLADPEGNLFDIAQDS